MAVLGVARVGGTAYTGVGAPGEDDLEEKKGRRKEEGRKKGGRREEEGRREREREEGREKEGRKRIGKEIT